MSRQRTPKVSHATDRQLAVGRSAVWSLFRPGETWLPYGYRAELGAAFLCADLGITPEVRPDHAAYIASWLQVLKQDKRLVFSAASHAQRAADYLHSLQAVQDDGEMERAA
jgi:antirestriction protein ArdC